MSIGIDRFWSKVHFGPGECWEWTGARNQDGYGIFHVPGTLNRVIRAHRFAYETFIGPIPEGLELDHLCRNHACVNPDHVEVVTNQENSRRGIAGIVNAQRQRAKTHCPRGHPYDEVNTLVRSNGRRECLTCKRARNRAWMKEH